MRSYHTTRSAAFTLVELLVVIVIISLLAMLVVPSIQQAMALGEHTKCRSNLHAMVNAHALYSSENRGSKPPLVWDRKGKVKYDWASPNVKMEDQAIGQGILVSKEYIPFSVILCPSSSMSADGMADARAWRRNTRAGCSYAYFWRHSSTVKSAAQLASGRKYFGCENDNRPALVMDVNAADGHRYVGAYEGTVWESHPRLRLVNIAYIDGTVRAVKNEKVKLQFPFNKTAELRWWDLAHKEY